MIFRFGCSVVIFVVVVLLSCVVLMIDRLSLMVVCVMGDGVSMCLWLSGVLGCVMMVMIL